MLHTRVLSIFIASGLSFSATAGIVYNESVDGDLSNSGLTPTSVTFAAGSNQVLGTTGRVTATDRDYFTFTVPAGLLLTSITELPDTQTGGAFSFIGLQAGNQVTLPTNPPDAKGLLGWWHYTPADINTDVLAKMSVSAMGSDGFTPPLPAGTYAVWIQDFTAGTYAYGFDFHLATPAAVPEPASYAMLILAAFSGTVVFRSQRPIR